MRKVVTDAQKAACYALVVRAVEAGARCPKNAEHGGPAAMRGNALMSLAREGQLRIEIADRNWRTVVLLNGKMAGKSTLTPPRGAKPWKIIGMDTRVHGKPVGREADRRMPSAPREIF